MTKGRVAVGKIESWLQEFESSRQEARQKGTDNVAISYSPGRKTEGYGV
jgi:hypothetical protein